MTTQNITVEINGHTMQATLVDNSSTEAFLKLLKEGSLSVPMHDYADMEKVGQLGISLPANNERITTNPGDIILYQGNQITIYYDENTWSLTRLGTIQNISAAELRNILGTGSVEVTFSLI